MESQIFGKILFNIQRYMILQTKLNPGTSAELPDEYVYAWYVKMYPISNSGDWHEDLADYFETPKETVETIARYLDEEWLQNRFYTFYELEHHFMSDEKMERMEARNGLLCVLRYYYLKSGFSKQFWDKLLEPGNHPIEATQVTTEFDSDEISLL